jgi:hypothetical protein
MPTDYRSARRAGDTRVAAVGVRGRTIADLA